MKVDFTLFPIYTSVRKDTKEAMNIIEPLANAIYLNVPGIRAHVLAEKIFTSNGPVELTNEDLEIIGSCTVVFTGVISDSLKDYIKDNQIKEREVSSED